MEFKNNIYLIDGIPAVDLVKKYDSPLYVYETAIMKSQFNRMKVAFKNSKVKIYFACKALTNINVLSFFKDLGAGLDAVSIQEVWMGLKAGFNPREIMYTPNGVSLEEIELAVKEGVNVNIDNISILEQFGHKHGNKIPVAIRINPHIVAGGHAKISTGSIDSKFGISYYQVPHVLRVVEANNMRIKGLHMHTGSDILDVEVFLRGAEILFETARHFKNLEFLDFGSGFKVSYKPDDYETDIESLGENLSQRFNEFCKE